MSPMDVAGRFRSSVTVVGMTCEHCPRSVTEELSAIRGVRSVDVDLGPAP